MMPCRTPSSYLPIIALLAVAALGQAVAADHPYPAHVRTDEQRAAWDLGWPQWHGPTGNSRGVDCGYRLVDDFSQARVVWQSEALIPPSDESPFRSGYATPVLSRGRVYVFYTWPKDLDYAIVKETGKRERAGLLTTDVADDTVLCLDALTGKTLWRRTFEGQGSVMPKSGKSGGHYTMCVRDGLAYAIGSKGRFWCLDAGTGETAWEGAFDEIAGKSWPNGCPMVAENAVVFLHPDHAALQAYDRRTGKTLWHTKGLGAGLRRASSPLCWRVGDRELILFEGTSAVSCFDPRDGRECWRIPVASSGNHIAFHDNRLVTDGTGARDFKGLTPETAHGLVCYHIAPDGFKELWRLPRKYNCCGQAACAIDNGKVYLTRRYQPTWGDGSDRDRKYGFAVFDLETGEVLVDIDDRGVAYAPIVAEGRYFGTSGYGLEMFVTEPQPMIHQRKDLLPMSIDCSAAYACGLLFVRGKEGVACIDLRQR